MVLQNLSPCDGALHQKQQFIQREIPLSSSWQSLESLSSEVVNLSKDKEVTML
jgi:hypothetical protein